MPLPPQGARRRLAFIDTARAIAVILVYLTHATENFWTIASRRGAWLTHLAHDANFGRMGVVTFFAVSGFLIPSSLGGTPLRGGAVFWINRFFRLYPAFCVSVPPAAYFLYRASGKAVPWHDVWVNFTMLPTWFGADYLNEAYWTLTVEMIFYLLCFFLFLGGAIRNQFVLACLMGLGFYAFLSSQFPIFSGALNLTMGSDATYLSLHLSIMFWGALCRQLWDQRRLEPVPAVLFAGVSLYWLLYRPFATAEFGGDFRLMYAYSLGMGVFVVLLVAGRGLGPVFSWLGRISYSFYLLHGPMIVLAYYFVAEIGFMHGRRMEVLVLFGFVVSAVVAQLSYTFIEKPAIDFGHRISGRLRTASVE